MIVLTVILTNTVNKIFLCRMLVKVVGNKYFSSLYSHRYAQNVDSTRSGNSLDIRLVVSESISIHSSSHS